MKTRTLALRVALNSGVMILVVYLFMQTAVYFRDSILLGTTDLSDFFPTVWGFIGGRVLPPLLVFSVLLWLVALPIQRVQARLEAGMALADRDIEKVRNRILRFRGIVLAINLVGFTVGFLLDLILSNRLGELTQTHRLSILTSNLMAGFVFAEAQTALNSLAFAPLRDRLGITAIGGRRKETSSTTRQTRLTVALVIYAALVIQYNQRDVTSFHSWGEAVLIQVQAGELSADEAANAYHELLTAQLPTISSRPVPPVTSLILPWTDPGHAQRQQESVFLLLGSLMVLIIAGVQVAISRDQRSWLLALRSRIEDVVGGGGDLRKRLSLRSMDDLGELAELVNRLLDQFQTIVGGIGHAAGQTREGARAVDEVLTSAERISAEVGASVMSLRAELEDQKNQAQVLSATLAAFREASSAVDSEAETQGQFVAETAAAMDEMAESIEGVRKKSREAGALTESLSQQGEGGGQAVRETSEAISGIHQASLEVLRVVGALKKIAADTNLLAMNAAIEAAHAGDKGAGFAVVADEVRKLANTASSQTKEIKSLIEAMARQVESGVERSRVSGEVLVDLVHGLETSAHVSRSVAEAMEEQAERTRKVSASLTQVVRTSQTIRTKMTNQGESTTQMGTSLQAALGRLDGLVEASRRQAQSVASLESSFKEVRRQVDRNAEAAEALQAEIGRFQV